MGKIYKTKLIVKSKSVNEVLKKMAGVYRQMFNLSLDAQFYKMCHSSSLNTQLLSETTLFNVIKVGEKNYSHIKEVDGGITKRATSNSNYSFRRWYNLRETRLPEYLSRKRGMNFGTASNIKVFYDYISIPKLGKIKLYEKGYIPQGKKYTNVTFSHDGKNWWIALEAHDKLEATEKSVNEFLCDSLSVYADLKGNLIAGQRVFSNIIEKDNYKAQKNKLKKLTKKLKRQKAENSFIQRSGKKVIRTSRNMMKTRARVKAVLQKMKEIKKDYFRKVATEVARTKPEELQMLSLQDIRKCCQGYLSRYLRESSTLELLNMVQRKAEAMGATLKRYPAYALINS